jgi:preprotein translocase subunit SecF
MFELIIGIVVAVLFSCLFLWAYRRGLKDGSDLNDNGKIEQTISEAAKKAEDAEKMLYEYMDITRKEALESYRKGLQEGISIQTKQEPIEVAREPVKSVEERKTEIANTTESIKAEQKQAQLISNLFEYDGSPQKEVDG